MPTNQKTAKAVFCLVREQNKALCGRLEQIVGLRSYQQVSTIWRLEFFNLTKLKNSVASPPHPHPPHPLHKKQQQTKHEDDHATPYKDTPFIHLFIICNTSPWKDENTRALDQNKPPYDSDKKW